MKLYVVNIPRTATEFDVSSKRDVNLFEDHRALLKFISIILPQCSDLIKLSGLKFIVLNIWVLPFKFRLNLSLENSEIFLRLFF